MQRREFILGSGAAIGAMTAGCLDVLGEESLRFEAGRATVPESVAESDGYEFVDSTDVVIERSFEVGGESRTVEVVNWLSQYEKTLDAAAFDGQRAAIFGALTTPQVEVLGRAFNPVAELSTEEIASRLQDQYEEIRDLTAGPETSITILGEETTVTRFDGEVELDGGATADVYVHVSDPVEIEDDFVIAVGGYPQQLSGEGDAVRGLMREIEYEAP